MNHTTTEERDALRAAARNYATPQELAAATGATIGKARRAFLYNEMVDRGERPRRPGRDAGIIDGDYSTVYLSEKQERFVYILGGNNLCNGVRIAIDEAMARRPHACQCERPFLPIGGWGCELCGGTVANTATAP